MSAPKIIAVIAQKGGAGKTATAIQFAALGAKAGRLQLLIDLDQQCNAAACLGYAKGLPGVYDVLQGTSTFDKTLLQYEALPHLLVLPGGPQLEYLEGRRMNADGKLDTVAPLGYARLFRESIGALDERVSEAGGLDLVVLDLPTGFSTATDIGLLMADYVLIVVNPEKQSVQGLMGVVKQIEERQEANPKLRMLGAMITRFGAGEKVLTKIENPAARVVDGEAVKRKHDEQRVWIKAIVDGFPGRVFQTVIPENEGIRYSPDSNKPVELYDPKGRGAVAYRIAYGEFRTILEKELTHGA